MTDSNRLVVVSQEYPPDKSGLSSRMRDMTTNLDSWDVDVIAPPPSFPHGEFDRQWYRSKTTSLDDVTVCRLWAWQPATSDPPTFSRLAHYITFALHATIWLLFHARRYDVVFTTTPPITTGLAGFVPRLAGAKWIVDVRDLWIDVSSSLGFIEENGLLERLSRAFQRQVLHTADSISVTTETLGETLCGQYGAELMEKIVVLPNGVEMSRFGDPVARLRESDEAATRESDEAATLDHDDSAAADRPVIVYVGNIGHAQALDVCVKAMDRIDNDALFRLVGGGDEVTSLQRLVKSIGVEDRVEFVDPVPREEIPGILAAADIGIAPIVKNDELAYAMPTKVYEYQGSGLPIVVTGQGEVERFVAESGGGLCADTDPDAVADALDTLLEDSELRDRMAGSGQEHVRSLYDRRHIAARLDGHLQELVQAESTNARAQTPTDTGAIRNE